MNIRRFTQIASGLVLCVASSWSLAKPALNGMAPHTELGKERFVAALYSNTLSKDANEILGSTEARRMELKVTARFLSARSLNSMWIEGMAINNSSAELEAQAENLAKLTNMVRKRLVTGDILAIDYDPSIGTTVSVNEVELGTIASPEFFPLLLRSWIGRVPLSSDFRKQLLAAGDVDAGLSARYASLETDPARAEVVAGWASATPPPPPPVVETESEEDDSPRVAVAPPPPPPPALIPATAPSTPAVTKPASQQASRAQAQSTVEAIKKQDPEKVAASLPKNKPSPAAPKPPAPPKPEPVAPVVVAKAAPPAPAMEEEDDDFEEEFFSASSLLDRQFYVSSSLLSIQKNVKYPRRALERDQQGNVRLAITVDRNGVVQEIVTVEESRYKALNRAAIDAVEDTAPFASIPKGVGGDSFTFTAPITFALQ